MATVSYNFWIGSINVDYNNSFQISIGSVTLDVSLASLRYHKKMYQPGYILTKLKLSLPSGATTMPDVASIIETFKNSKVTLEVTTDSDTDTIAKNYYVYKVVPEYTTNASGQYVYVTLEIYSPDHKLTLDKYCKTHVNKKLCTDIITDELSEIGILHAAGFSTETVDCTNRRFLNYYYKSNNQLLQREFIQPYLVQYNESFYDFMNRTANRCGEYFYYEGGVLYVGLKKSTSVRVIDKSTALSIKYQDVNDSLVKTSKFCLDSTGKAAGSYANYDTAAVAKAISENKSDPENYGKKDTVLYPFYDEVPVDEYLGMAFKKDSFSTFGDEFSKGWWPEFISLLNSVLNMSTPTKMIAKLTAKYAEALIFAGGKVAEANRKGNEKWVAEKDGTGKQIHAAEQYDSSSSTATLYGSMLSSADKDENCDVQQNLNTKFYQFVSKGCNQVSKQLICLNVGVEKRPFMLGDEVAFEKGDTATKYIVTEVSEALQCETENANLAEWQVGQLLTIVPYYTLSTKKAGEEYSLTMPCPPMMHPFVKASGPQRAYVAENNDPKKLGRVCIRYPWQNMEEVSSPWIRMAVPFAPNDSKSGGMLFVPCKGDEVLVDYENGNMEHPYIIGSLYTSRSKAPGKNRSIVSQNGHSISFNDGDSVSDFVSGVAPALGMLQQYAGMVGFGDAISFGDDNSFCGGVCISDKWGLYKIEASATNRNITVRSPFGDVKIGALTGIELSAPNGDITIKGKNVNIEAGNEVSIVSGKFIDEKKKDAADIFSSFAKDLAGNLLGDLAANFTDFSILRTVWEALLKPVGGTLTVQSGRYLLLNAGGAKAEIPNKGYSIDGLRNKENENYASKVKVAKTICKISEIVESGIGNVWEQYEKIPKMAEEYKTKYDHKVKDSKKDSKAILNEIYTAEYYDFDSYKFIPMACSMREKGDVLRLSNGILQTGKALLLEAESLRDGTNVDLNDSKIFGKELKSVMKDCLPPIIKNICEKSDKTFAKTKADFDNCKQLFKRKLIVKFVEASKQLDQKPPLGTAKITFSADSDYLSATKWRDYINYLADYVEKKGALAKLGSGLADLAKSKMTENLPGLGWSDERGLWDTCKQGEILMADKGQDETLNIVNGALNRNPHNDNYLESIKQQLLNI